MKTYDISPKAFRVGDFLGWQKDGSLNLNPPFQRRSVWKLDARSYFIDTVVRGLPVPLIFLREKVNLRSGRVLREVVDGQQRLRTIFSFIDEDLLDDFDVDRDRFTVKKNHNKEIAEKGYDALSSSVKKRILGYQFSVEVLPSDMEDREILQVFARLNSTGAQLNRQELRNAKFFGELKTSMYSLAYEQFERWLDWEVLTEDQLARMREVELTSDLSLNMAEGLSGKTQKRLDDFYDEFDERLPGRSELERRFRRVMDVIDEELGDVMTESIFHSEIHFFTLFVYVYDRLWGLGESLARTKADALPRGFRTRALRVSDRFHTGHVPREVLDAVQRASTDLGRRETRFDYFAAMCDGTPG